jgi:hypothetical protein
VPLFYSWEDGKPTEHATEMFDRWSIHAANELLVSICGIDIKVIQKVSPADMPHLAELRV